MNDNESVLSNKGIMDAMTSCVSCCKHCKTETAIDRLMQIEPAEAPLQPSVLLHHSNNVLQRKA